MGFRGLVTARFAPEVPAAPAALLKLIAENKLITAQSHVR
jgi:hypothetical protein